MAECALRNSYLHGGWSLPPRLHPLAHVFILFMMAARW